MGIFGFFRGEKWEDEDGEWGRGSRRSDGKLSVVGGPDTDDEDDHYHIVYDDEGEIEYFRGDSRSENEVLIDRSQEDEE